MSDQAPTSKPYFLILLAAFLFAFLAIFTQALTNQGISAFNQVIWRAIFNSIFGLLTAKLIFRQRLRLTRQEFHLIAMSSLFLFAAVLTFTGAIYLGTPVAKAVALNYAYPLPVIMFTYLLFKESPSRKQVLAVFLSLISLIPLLELWQIRNLFKVHPSDLLALGNAVTFAALFVWGIKIRRQSSLHPLKIIGYSFLFTLPLIYFTSTFLHHHLGISLYTPELRTDFSLISWLTLIAMSAFGSAIPSAIVYYSIKHLKPVTASLLLLTDPIWTYILGIFFFNQHLSGWNLLGMTGILLAILLT